MRYCTNCGNPNDDASRFCTKCGEMITAEATGEPVNTMPAEEYNTPVYSEPSQPAVPAEPVVSGGDKAKGFVGMGLAILGLVFAGIGFLYTLIGLTETGLALGMAIAFGIFSLPPALIGGNLCKKSRAAGNTSRACTSGTSMAAIATILTIGMLIVGVIGLGL